MANEYLTWLQADWHRLDSAWTQPYIVTTYCRILMTVATGRVASKGDALQWGLDNLDDDWHPLIRAALDDRPDPWGRVHREARPGTVQATKRFVWFARTTALGDASPGDGAA